MEEILEIVDMEGNVISTALRSEIHGNPALVHKVVHVLVFLGTGDLLLQKRSMQKDVAPGKWDTSVGGHMAPGESEEQAALREMQEELGIIAPLEFLYKYVHSSNYETEMVYTFKCILDGEITFDPEEIDEVRPWSIKEIRENMGSGLLSDNFIHEINTFLEEAYK